ncbi:hypothetical protein ERO13_D05G033700v2 [Gossypium hirsutum]|uniref:Glycosyltransferase n=1 Tax=Gossypium hirsutum TaxID=3635 RepID=A0A1U8JHT9_GOSHI|nr:UDP-glycosyltransferase 73C3-like [Gossypium hirsutum]KAG4144385.1 hypothetical protein ERO13_D05G033700v2 [Gossypium hirsutum]
MASLNQQPIHHFLFIPLMTRSHLIPFTDLAKALAHHGQQVTIVMTPLNAARFSDDYAINFNLNIQFLPLYFPAQEVGLPQGCEAMDSLPSPDMATKFLQASNMLQQPLEKWLQGLDSLSLPSCIISDVCFPWTSILALKFNVSRVVFHTVSCFTLLCSHNIDHYKVFDERDKSDFEPVLVPDLPDRIEITKAQLPFFGKNKALDDSKKVLKQFKEAEASAMAVVVNSFQELEPGYVKAYQKFVNNLWCIGPLCLYNKTTRSEASIDDHESLNWLDSQKPNSVIYVCFGSLCHIFDQQLMELGLGLETSNCPFIWVIKEGSYTAELDNWFKEQNFEERVKGRGLIIRGWAPQFQILSKPAIGGLITHCGWSSTLEGIIAGLPLITWPMSNEQFYNEKLIVQVVKIGVKIGVEKPMKAPEVLVKKEEEVLKAIKQVIDGGKEGEERKKRAKKLGEMAKMAVENGGSSCSNLTSLIHLVSYFNQHG